MTTIDNFPRSIDMREPGCFLPLPAIIFYRLYCTVVIRVSSTLNILDREKLYFSWSGSKRSKKILTTSFLKLLILAADVASGVRRDNLFLKKLNATSASGPFSFIIKMMINIILESKLICKASNTSWYYIIPSMFLYTQPVAPLIPFEIVNLLLPNCFEWSTTRLFLFWNVKFLCSL